MNLTRVDSAKLKAAVDSAKANLEAALKALEAHLVILPEDERLEMLKPPANFPQAARQMAQAMTLHPEMAKFAGYEGAAAMEDLVNVEILEVLAPLIHRISQMTIDSKLKWMAELYEQTLIAYRVAKLQTKNNAKLAEDITPVVEYFSSRLRKKA